MDEKKTEPTLPICSCAQDLFANLPAELRPKPVLNMGGLRNVTCPSCRRVYWTNRDTNLCIECEKKGVRVTQSQKEE